MLEETLERLERTKATYEQLAQQMGQLLGVIEAAIAHADLTVIQHRDANEMAGIAFSVRGGMTGGGDEIGTAGQRLVTLLENVRSMLSSARLTAQQGPVVVQGQIGIIDSFIELLRR